MRHMPFCPMMMQMPMMKPMSMYSMHNDDDYYEEDDHDEDDRDEEYFAEMYGENSNRMLPYVTRTVNRLEKKGDMIYEEYPDRQIVEKMSEEAYANMVRDMPDMADENEETRQFGGKRRFGRDLITLLLINELLRRRRRRRRRHGRDFWEDNFMSNENNNDFYYNE